MTVHARVTREPLSVHRLADMVGRPAAGAIVTFQGLINTSHVVSPISAVIS